MSVTEKAVVRYEAVCDFCGEFLGETSTSDEAYVNLSIHTNHAYTLEAAEGGVHFDAIEEAKKKREEASCDASP